ncbi:hypothetical protein GL305_34130 [Nocardia seriolae]|nr:hypothetical protein [Nocardia seriolae]APB01516.1 hypothetical protein NS506_07496 [Nocardia seriolae]MTJ70539.1 hypothetical protein [Nocardia seriolae]MTJ90868.1 hypothetical protein [Nocardia seriolae]MTK34825.1 hypothetical protein [Nocardia seriolae]MTK51443.1 hypothetical protein [Nocardia seriolae]
MSTSKRARGRGKRKAGRGGGCPSTGQAARHREDCPGCRGEEFDPHGPVDTALAVASEFGDDVDIFRVELLIAELLTPSRNEDLGLTALFGAWAVLVLEARATEASVGLLRGIARLSSGELSRAAGAAADRLEANGVAAPRWCDRLLAPIRAIEFTRSAAAHLAVLLGSFERGGDIHGFLVLVDLRDGGVAARILPLEGDESDVERQLAGVGLPGVTQRLTPDEFRRELESALGRRVRRDRADLHRGVSPIEDEEGDEPPYAQVAAVLRAHMRAIEFAVAIADGGCESKSMPAMEIRGAGCGERGNSGGG